MNHNISENVSTLQPPAGLDELLCAVRRLLDRGYRVKTALFRYFPRLYLALYHIWKKG